MSGILSNEKGMSRISVYLWFLLLFAVGHVAIKIVPPYMDYSRMKDAMTMKAGLAQVLKDDEILRDLVNKAKDLDLPLTPEDFVLERDGDRRKMRVSTAWDVEMNFFWGAYRRTEHFAPAVEENFMSIVR